MNDILIKGTDKLPSVNLDAGNGIIEIAGCSIPEDGKEFYEEIVKWLRDYATDPQPLTKVTFKLEYINSSSHISIKNIITQLETILYKEGRSVEISWYYEDDDPSMLATANDFKSLTRVPIKIVPVKEL